MVQWGAKKTKKTKTKEKAVVAIRGLDPTSLTSTRATHATLRKGFVCV